MMVGHILSILMSKHRLRFKQIAHASSEKFLEALEPSRKPWAEREIPFWIFRGNWNSNWHLVPSAWRGKRQDIVHGFKAWSDQQVNAEISLEKFARKPQK